MKKYFGFFHGKKERAAALLRSEALKLKVKQALQARTHVTWRHARFIVFAGRKAQHDLLNYKASENVAVDLRRRRCLRDPPGR